MVSFVFEPGDRLDEGVRREIRRQLKGASRALADPEVTAEGIHRSRRCLKRARSIIVLLKSMGQSETWIKPERGIRDAARSLGGARDLKSKLDALAKLEDWSTDAGLAPAFSRLKRTLEARRKQQEDAVGSTLATEVAGKLQALAPQFTRKRLRKVRPAGLIEAVAETYGRGRKSMAKALAAGTDDAYHEWRKHLQRHWRHMQLFSRAWPAEMTVRIATARELSRLLGEDHDLHMLQVFVETEHLPIARAKRERIAALCAQMQAELRVQAGAAGRRLFAERPDAFAGRMKKYWSLAVELKPHSQRPLETPQTSPAEQSAVPSTEAAG